MKIKSWKVIAIKDSNFENCSIQIIKDEEYILTKSGENLRVIRGNFKNKTGVIDKSSATLSKEECVEYLKSLDKGELLDINASPEEFKYNYPDINSNRTDYQDEFYRGLVVFIPDKYNTLISNDEVAWHCAWQSGYWGGSLTGSKKIEGGTIVKFKGNKD